MPKSEKSPRERRRYPIGHDPRREQRRDEALARQALYTKLTREERVARAQSRPGNAKRELGRLEING